MSKELISSIIAAVLAVVAIVVSLTPTTSDDVIFNKIKPPVEAYIEKLKAETSE